MVANRISDGLFGSHSGATAEGDNAVLMQKIVKDILTDIRADKYDKPVMTKCPKRGLPAQDSVADLESLANLIYYREVWEVKQIMNSLKTKVMEEGKEFYTVWMTEVMDQVQATALAYAERIMLEGAISDLEKRCSNPGAKTMLSRAITLHCLSIVRKDLGWYLREGVISAKAASEIEPLYQQSIQDNLQHTNDWLDALDQTKSAHLHAPITRDYVTYSGQADHGNISVAGGFFDGRQARL